MIVLMMLAGLAGLMTAALGLFLTFSLSEWVLHLTSDRERWWSAGAWMAFGLCVSVPALGASIFAGVFVFVMISGVQP